MNGYPTDEGKKRYEPDGIYTGGMNDRDYWKICTCKPECDHPCKGVCGCEACHMSYMDFLSCE